MERKAGFSSFMADKNRYIKLDEVGLVGSQGKKKSASSERYHQRKTGEIFRRARAAGQKAPAASKVTR
jgi:hypothetical protein